ncbi:isocitrate lyase/phosphoenolpyruvate mutase family protein [Allosphingosinicella deserti]|uniref:isocitrate lyase/phosphoenolpyruvate mutase family protein n=1 Tax=Allosphingosinicella deserti TaxID=2116704 RepID=UPI0022B869F0|nr:isocitrate lyase/phosphoenolpyruvate mutase family protein [Sphingomonas deserti]
MPGLADPALIERICSASHLPVNIMVLDIDADLAPLAAAGVARISFGPAPYLAAMGALTEVAGRALGQ